MNDDLKIKSDLKNQRIKYLELSKKLYTMSRINSILSNRVAYLLNNIIRNSFIPQMKVMLNKKGLSLAEASSDYDWVNSSYAGFVINVPDWKYFAIGIEFERKWLKSPIIGFLKKDEYTKDQIDCWEDLKKKYSERDPNNSYWIYKSFTESNDWDTQEAIEKIVNGEMVKAFENEIEELLDCAKEIKKMYGENGI